MLHLTLDNLKSFAKSLEDQTIRTTPRGKEFTVTVLERGFEYTPRSSGTPRLNDYETVQRILDLFNERRYRQPKDYLDMTRNASYTLTLIELFLERK